MLVTIKDLKKRDRFLWNDYIYLVTKKYRNDDSPLKAINETYDDGRGENLFHNEDLPVEKIAKR